VWEAGGGEDGDFLTTGDRVHDVNGGDSGLDHGLGIIAGGGVDGLSVNVQVGLGQYLGTGVNDFTGAVEGSPQHLLGHAHFEDVAGEFASGLTIVNVGGSLKYLDDGAGASYLEDLTGAGGPVAEGEVDDFGVFGEFDVVEDDQGTVDSGNGAVCKAQTLTSSSSSSSK